MAFSSKLSIICGAAHSRQAFCFVMSALDLDEPKSVLITYGHDDIQPWSRHEIDDETVDVTTLQTESGVQAKFVAVTQEGTVLYLNGETGQDDIPEAGLWAEGEVNGALARIESSDGKLYAIGDGGQVYQKENGGIWSRHPLGIVQSQVGVPDLTASNSHLLGRFVVGGKIYSDFEFTDEMMAAEVAGDFDKLQVLMDNQTGSVGALFVSEASEWRQIELATDAVPVAMIERQAEEDEALIIFDQGFISTTKEFETFEFGEPIDIEAFGGFVDAVSGPFGTCIAAEAGLFRIDLDRLVPFDPAPPDAAFGSSVSLVDTADCLFLFLDNAVYVFDGELWENVIIPSSLVQAEFSGLAR